METLSAPAVQSVQPAQADRAVGATAAVPAARRGYSILVASFENRGRAERSVEELTNAGFGAHAVERDGGQRTARFTLVRVTGYTSALDVQRDLAADPRAAGGLQRRENRGAAVERADQEDRRSGRRISRAGCSLRSGTPPDLYRASREIIRSTPDAKSESTPR